MTAAASLANAVFQMGQQIGLVTNGRDAADRIRQEGWDFDIRTRSAAQQAASMLADERSAAAAGRRDPPRARAIAAHPGNAGPRRTDRRAGLAAPGAGNGQPAAARRHGGGDPDRA